MRSPLIPTFLLAITVALLDAPAMAQFATCQECDVRFSLTHAEVICLERRIDRLLVRSDPVYFDAAGCNQNEPVMSSTAPTITPPNPTVATASKWLQLTKQQLQCLRSELPRLKENRDEPVQVSLSISDCAGTQ